MESIAHDRYYEMAIFCQLSEPYAFYSFLCR